MEAPGARLGLVYRKNGIDLDGRVERQARAAYRDARMAPLLPEHFDDQLGGAVDDFGMVGIALDRVHIAVETQALDDAIEVAEGGFSLGENIERAEPRGVLALVEIEVVAKRAGHGEATAFEGQLSRYEKLAVEVKIGHVIGHGRGDLGQHQVESLQPRFDLTRHAASNRPSARLVRVLKHRAN